MKSYFLPMKIMRPPYNDKFLTKDGKLILFKKNLEDMNFLRMRTRKLVSEGKL